MPWKVAWAGARLPTSHLAAERAVCARAPRGEVYGGVRWNVGLDQVLDSL